MRRSRNYVGLRNDEQGGMSPTGNIVRDAWVFGLLPEDDDCAGWTSDRLDRLYDQVHAAWAPYGHLVSNLPPELKAKHARIYSEAVKRAREQGWDPHANLEEV